MENLLIIELPQRMLDVSNKEYEPIRQWAKNACEMYKNGEISGVCIPKNMGINIYILTPDGKKLLELEKRKINK